MSTIHRLAFTAALAATLSSGLHAQFFGAPSPAGQTHAHVFSSGYTRVSEDFEAHHCSISGSVTGAGGFNFANPCSGGRRVRSNRFWLADSYALNERWELTGELGGQDVRIDDIFEVDANGQNLVNPTFSQSYRPYGGIGVRGLFAGGVHHGFGMITKLHYYGKFSDSRGGSYTDPLGDVITYKVEFRPSAHWDGNFALAYQYRWGNGSAWYIGPFGYWTEPTWDYNASATITFLGVPYTADAFSSTKMRPKHAYGAMTGFRFAFAGNWRLLAEAQYRNGFTGTVGFGYAF